MCLPHSRFTGQRKHGTIGAGQEPLDPLYLGVSPYGYWIAPMHFRLVRPGLVAA
ncbi:MAG: hypothetical protein LC749_04670 [Actinobacteria bacterium]|nr:hypothetical protein [Actinomycetota bacterium]